MHPIDRAAGWLFRYGPDSLKVFVDGWGNEELLAALDTSVELDVTPAVEIAWAAGRVDAGLMIRDGSFTSPAPDLPPWARSASLRMIAPEASDGRLVVMMAAWNEHGFATRTHLAKTLAARGITSVMLENPFYGSRRRNADPPIRTVADFGVMGRAAVIEGLALLAHFASEFEVGVTGYSMGGNIAALVGALCDHGVAIAALAASHSPGPVWMEGVIRHTIDWPALGGATAFSRLGTELGKATVLAVPPRPHTRRAIIVGGSRDGYIPRHAVEDLQSHWPGSELRWIDAGHATMIWRHKRLLVEAITDSFARAAGRQAD